MVVLGGLKFFMSEVLLKGFDPPPWPRVPHPKGGTPITKLKRAGLGAGGHDSCCGARGGLLLFFFTPVTGPRRSLSLKLSDTRVYEPQIRARLGNTARGGLRTRGLLTGLQLSTVD